MGKHAILGTIGPPEDGKDNGPLAPLQLEKNASGSTNKMPRLSVIIL